MTPAQKQQIYKLLLQGMSYKVISWELLISVDAVKSYCKRYRLNDLAQLDDQANQNAGLCLQCNKPIRQKKRGRSKKFCSDVCRYAWWNENQNKRNKNDNAIYQYTCQHCGRKFVVYGDKDRKYCSHECYINYRCNNVIKSKSRFWE